MQTQMPHHIFVRSGWDIKPQTHSCIMCPSDVQEYRRDPGDRDAGDSLSYQDGMFFVPGAVGATSPITSACVLKHGSMGGW